MKAGLIGISNNKKGLFPWLIRFFTMSKWTHCFITLGKIQGEDSVFEAGQLVQIVPFETHYSLDPTETFLLFEINANAITASSIDEALSSCFYSYAGAQYGYLQLPWFIYRWLMKVLFKTEIKKGKNWFTQGIICSELVYHYLWLLGPQFQSALSSYSHDTIQAQDILDIMGVNPHLFTPYKVEG